MKRLIIIFVLISSVRLYSQELNWLLEPIISEADEIFVTEQFDSLIVILKQNKYGLKNIHNNQILETSYDELYLSYDEKYILTKRNDTIRNYYSNLIPLESTLFSKNRYYSYFTNIQKRFDEIKDKLNGTSIKLSMDTIDFKINFILSFENGKKHKTDKPYAISVLDGFNIRLSDNNNGDIFVVNKEGNEVFRYFKAVVFKSNKFEYFKNRDFQETQIFDKNWNVINFEGPVTLYKELPFFKVNMSNEYLLYDTLFNPVYNKLSNSITFNEEDSLIFFQRKNKTIIFDYKRNEYDSLNFEFYSNIDKPSIKYNDKYGIYDFLKNEFVLEPRFDRIDSRGSNTESQMVIASNVLRPWPNGMSKFYLYNDKYNLITFFYSSEANRLTNNSICYKDSVSGNFKLIGFSGNEIFKFESKHRIRSPHESWICTSSKKRNENCFLVSDLIHNKELVFYHFVAEVQINNEEGKYFIVEKEGKKGIIRKDGKLIYDFIFNDLKFFRKRNLGCGSCLSIIYANIDGLWGILSLD